MANVDFLSTPIEYLKGVGPQKADILHKEFNIYNFRDLLFYLPYRHVDKSKIYRIADINNDSAYIQIKGRIISHEIVGQQRAKRLVAKFADDTGVIELVWFNSLRWVEDMVQQKKEYIVFGKPTQFNNRWNITHPEMIDPQAQTNSPVPLSFQPLYNTSDKAKKKGLDSKAISKLIYTLLSQPQLSIPETLSESIINSVKLIPLEEAIYNIHYPASGTLLSKAILRLKFDELFFTQLKMLKIKLITSQKIKGYRFDKVGDYFNTFYKEHLPFELTGAQKRVIKEIRADVGSGRQMNRLLQGDVGSGKTITALLIMLIAKDNNYQSCLMAPTEILATQHYENISKLLAGMNMRVEFLSGSTKTAKRKEILEGLQNGDVDILIGTHALIEDNVIFKQLGLVVIDEQHRFGVEQRAKLWRKSSTAPHVLVMTATPIPRTLAMTLYGDLDLSIINELPKGRKPIITRHLTEHQRLQLIGFMRREIAAGRQIFVVYPLIEESEKMDLQNLMHGYEMILHDFPRPQYQASVVHGRMKSEDKDAEMQRFIRKETQILLSTTVIEVGIDVPNATVMIIENAERFGLSQLHQLRGRVGRGGDQSYCILMTGDKLSNDSKLRIEAMVSTTDGFEIANIDLKLRGPGDIQGLRQSGMMDFKIADIVKDEKIVAYTRQLAKKILEEDPNLTQPQNRPMAIHLAEMLKGEKFWGMIS
ncbi:MAG: ATP-dependent DNA helicase RecG [Bacteroidales bacterium]|nr:ATP-dependent DNA helicase RecG [Bacteroidales bacterium]